MTQKPNDVHWQLHNNDRCDDRCGSELISTLGSEPREKTSSASQRFPMTCSVNENIWSTILFKLKLALIFNIYVKN